MRKIYKMTIVLLALFVFTATIVKAQSSKPENGKTYHLVFQRYHADLAIQDMGDDAILTAQGLVWTETSQKWTVTVEAEGEYVFTSGNGRTIYFADGRFKAGTTKESFVLREYPGNGYPNSLVIGRKGSTNQSINPAGGSKVGKEIAEYNDGDGGNAIKIVNPKTLLLGLADEYQAELDAAPEGDNPGQFTAATKVPFQEAINTAKGVSADDDYDQAYLDAIDVLKAAKTAFLETVTKPEIGKKYYIQGTRPDNTYMTDDQEGGVKDLAVIPDDTQIWEVVAVDAGFGFKNVATGNYINPDVANNNVFPTAETAPVKALKFRTSSEMRSNQLCFFIENFGGDAVRFHAGGSGHGFKVMNWTGNENDNCSWRFIDQAVALKGFLKEKIDATVAIKDNTPLGDDFGQYPQSAKDAIQTAINNAQTVYDDANASEEQVNNAMTSLEEAINTYKEAINSDVNTLVSTDANKYRWYVIRNTTTKEYGKNKVISYNGRNLGDRYTYEDKTEVDEQLFRFEVDGNNIKIIDYAGNYMAANGTITNTTEVSFELKLLEDGYSFNITAPESASLHAQQSGSHIVNWNGNAGSASAWVFEFIKEATTQSTSEYVTVSIALDAENTADSGTIEILGAEGTSVTKTTTGSVSVKATPKPGYVFAKWSDGTNDFDTPKYTYSGEADVTLTATFEKLGTGMVEAPAENTYYYIQLASDGSVTTGGYTGDFRNHILIASDNDNEKVIHDVKGNAGDKALWLVLKDSNGILKLKNKGTGRFLKESKLVVEATDTDAAEEVIFTEIANNQYAINNAGSTPLINWKNNVGDRWKPQQGENSLSAFYFVKHSMNTGIKDLMNNKYRVVVSNGIIRVEGADNFEVYSITGQRVDARRSLRHGIYIVRAKQFVQKVIVK